jgi:hypothetical protein
MTEFIRGAMFIAICLVDILAIGLGIGLYISGAA